jgi:hypothetical protein
MKTIVSLARSYDLKGILKKWPNCFQRGVFSNAKKDLPDLVRMFSYNSKKAYSLSYTGKELVNASTSKKKI